jgi:hypothetical protein
MVVMMPAVPAVMMVTPVMMAVPIVRLFDCRRAFCNLGRANGQRCSGCSGGREQRSRHA